MSLIMIVAVGALMYFMMIRPAQRRLREQQQMQSSLQPGNRVLLASGIVGTLKHLGDKQAVLELAPGTDVTVLKGAITSVLGPEDEEFEYADDLDGDGVLDATPVAPAAGTHEATTFTPAQPAPLADPEVAAAAPALVPAVQHPTGGGATAAPAAADPRQGA